MTEVEKVGISPDADTDAKMRAICLQMIEMIKAGDFDDYIKIVDDNVKFRIRAIQLQTVASLCAGDIIYISRLVKPQLLAGAAVEVVEIMPDNKVKVRLHRTYSTKWRQGNLITLTPSLIGEKVR
ncbi:MAG TPA: hypothetical protein VH187_13630 [Scandinavium sp.]|uniref:hypothetical protein n=1 Tax=Scandinavium sp. TaxID=2830653 RepID=UPI002E36D962|nr:hypothetical protein [Scandinavium sp.]HEX4502172.1 hypothetical protein [Scandinavium sp.]